MFQKFSSVTNIFQRRYNNTFHALRITWTKLRESLNKTFGVAISTLYAGASAFRVIDNMFRLMTIVSIAILGILLGFVVFFFFILWPILPLILIAVYFVSQTPYAGEVMGMESAFCFAPDTQVNTVDGPKPIKSVVLGEKLVYNGKLSTVTGTMLFEEDYEPLYNLYGVQVSGSHIYFDEGIPVFVKSLRDAWPMAQSTRQVYCLMTSDHKIPIVSNRGVLLFADWEEISDSDLESWNKFVFEELNGLAKYIVPSESSLDSEAGVSWTTKVDTPLGPSEIRNLRPGVSVFSADGTPTRVKGVVKLEASSAKSAMMIDSESYLSAGCWIHKNGIWQQPSDGCGGVSTTNQPLYQLFTESGTFRVFSGSGTISLRDFSDVGSQNIEKSYNMVLEALTASAFTEI
jgi:hypothetical protein